MVTSRRVQADVQACYGRLWLRRDQSSPMLNCEFAWPPAANILIASLRWSRTICLCLNPECYLDLELVKVYFCANDL